MTQKQRLRLFIAKLTEDHRRLLRKGYSGLAKRMEKRISIHRGLMARGRG